MSATRRAADRAADRGGGEIRSAGNSPRRHRSLRCLALLGALAGTLPACAPPPTGASPPTTAPAIAETPPGGPDAALVRIALVGDVMLGRGLAATVASAPDEVFAGVRHLLAGADIAGANLESPLTTRAHVSSNENVLVASPDAAAALATGGFDLLSLANNHATDAGPAGILDSMAAAAGVGLRTVGGGADAAAATAPLEIEVGGLVVGFLAFDATGLGEAAGEGPGVAVWDRQTGPGLVAESRATADVVVVSIHGGSEYLATNDPLMRDIAAEVVAAGADIVWGHGAHVMQPVYPVESERPAVVATSLGNFAFDQSGPGRTTGALLEVLAGAAGVVAYRVAVTEHDNGRVRFVEWEEPETDAAWLAEAWWTLVDPPRPAHPGRITVDDFRHGDLIAAAAGDVTATGTRHVVASFRRPFVETDYARLRPEIQWADRSGRSAHLGLYTVDALTEVWVAGSVALPVAEVAVCTGAIAVAHDSLDDPTVTAAGAWVWSGFGFETAPDLPGAGTPGCADVDRDGRTEPVVLNRVSATP